MKARSRESRHPGDFRFVRDGEESGGVDHDVEGLAADLLALEVFDGDGELLGRLAEINLLDCVPGPDPPVDALVGHPS